MIYLLKKSIQSIRHRQFSARAVSCLIFSVLILLLRLLVVRQEDFENYHCSAMNFLRTAKGSTPAAIHSHIFETPEEESQRTESRNSSSTRMLSANRHSPIPSLITKRSFDFDVLCRDKDDDWIHLGAFSGDENHSKSGSSISLSADGTVLAIGTPFSDANGLDSGHVRIYKYTLYWLQVGIDIVGAAANDNFGRSVSLSADGTMVAVGAPGNDANGVNSGHVRVYKMDTSSDWTQVGGDIKGEASGDYSGISVSLSADGTILAVGANGNDINEEIQRSGHVRVYNLTATGGWKQVGDDINGEAAADTSGYSVSISADGETLAVGATNNDGNGDKSGHTRVYKRDTTSSSGWKQIGDDIDGEAAGDYSGFAVRLSNDGTRLVISAPQNDGNGIESGHVRAYKRDLLSPTGWKHLGEDIDGELVDDHFGRGLALSGNGMVIAIGAPFSEDLNEGKVKVYRRDISSLKGWTQIGSDLEGEAYSDHFGTSISISLDGTILAVAAPNNNHYGVDARDVGLVRVFGYCGANRLLLPSPRPSINPSYYSSQAPSMHPSIELTNIPSLEVSDNPSILPSNKPSPLPSFAPTIQRTPNPTLVPSMHLSSNPSNSSSSAPSFSPSSASSSLPSFEESSVPSFTPSSKPTSIHSLLPTMLPTFNPSPDTQRFPFSPTNITDASNCPRLEHSLIRAAAIPCLTLLFLILN